MSFSDAVMQEEIFGPILPILVFDHIGEVIRNVNAMPHPLALYIFTSDKRAATKVLARCGFGGASVNHTITHLAHSGRGFGGFGWTGAGRANGRDGGYDAAAGRKGGGLLPKDWPGADWGVDSKRG